jgi:hypothetical protein
VPHSAIRLSAWAASGPHGGSGGVGEPAEKNRGGWLEGAIGSVLERRPARQ